jgi:hypothetical protein
MACRDRSGRRPSPFPLERVTIMRPRTLGYLAVFACGLLALSGVPAVADDKKDDKPALSGTWARKEGDLVIKFADKDVVKFQPHGDKKEFTVVCSYTREKEGRLKVKITELDASDEVKQKAKDHLPIGLEFSFQWKVKGDSAQLGNLEGKDVEMLKSHLEGEYQKKSD